jgi:hypothetical protein
MDFFSVNCSDSAHALFVRATYLVCHRLISSWKADLNTSLAALEMLTGLARIHIPDQGQCHAPSHPHIHCCGSGSGKDFLPDPGSQTYIFESLMTIFWVRSPKNHCKLAQIFFALPVQKLNYFSIL